MNFGENLQNLRKQHNLSQEELADQIGVSRQAISKWESGTATPELDKIIQLSELFHCQIDELIRGNITPTDYNLKSAYNKLMNSFSRNISLAIAIILIGTTIFLSLSSFSQPYTDYGLVVFLIFVAIGTPIFVVNGMTLGNFKSKHPKLDNFYTTDEVDAYNIKFSHIIATAIAVILIGLVTFMTFMVTNVFGTESPMPAAVFMIFVTLGAPLFVYAGIQKGKYDIARYNYENSAEYKALSEKVSKISGVIMMIATMIFLALGFTLQLWHICWVVYPIAGILCGIVSTLLQKNPR